MIYFLIVCNNIIRSVFLLIIKQKAKVKNTTKAIPAGIIHTICQLISPSKVYGVRYVDGAT
jgi:penicillin-binding protein-related factor A (putative recombinase)